MAFEAKIFQGLRVLSSTWQSDCLRSILSKEFEQIHAKPDTVDVAITRLGIRDEDRRVGYLYGRRGRVEEKRRVDRLRTANFELCRAEQVQKSVLRRERQHVKPIETEDKFMKSPASYGFALAESHIQH